MFFTPAACDPQRDILGPAERLFNIFILKVFLTIRI